MGRDPCLRVPRCFLGTPSHSQRSQEDMLLQEGRQESLGLGAGGQVPGTAVCVCSGPETQAPLEKFKGLGVEAGAGELLVGGSSTSVATVGGGPVQESPGQLMAQKRRPGAGARPRHPTKGRVPQVSSLFLCLVMEHSKDTLQNVIEKKRAARAALESQVRRALTH